MSTPESLASLTKRKSKAIQELSIAKKKKDSDLINLYKSIIKDCERKIEKLMDDYDDKETSSATKMTDDKP